MYKKRGIRVSPGAGILAEESMRATQRQLRIASLALLVFSLLPGFAGAQDVSYVCFDGGAGLKGDSTDPSHVDWIVAYGLDHGSSKPGASPLFTDVFVLKGTDKASPFLHEKLAQGTTIPKVVIDVCSEPSGGSQDCYSRLLLENVKIVQVDTAGTSCVDPATSCTPSQTESVGLNFTKISWAQTQGGGGKTPQTLSCTCWNLSTNSSCTCPSDGCNP